jgi:branched-chain amino acid transport system permease protein
MEKRSPHLYWMAPAAAILLVALPFITPYKALASQMLIFAIFAIGYDICFGYTGLLSFGHAAFFGLGAYATGLSLIHLSVPAPVGLLFGIVASVIASFFIGLLSIRRHGIYFAMVTLAFGQVVYFIVFKWRSVTGGDDGLHGVPRPPLGPVDFTSELVLYYFILLCFIGALLFGIRIIRSPFGKTLECLRENEARAKNIGYNPRFFKLTSFMLSASFAGLAGGLYALLQNFVPLFALHLDTSGDIVLMTLIGGMGTLYGPIMGAMGLIYMKDLLSTYTNVWPLILGLLYVVSVMVFRKGIFRALKNRIL